MDVKMKEDLGSLKHECVIFVESDDRISHTITSIQMELDTRKNESKAQLKQQTIAIEVRMIFISVAQFGNFVK